MRAKKEIEAEIAKLNTAKRNAERKRAKCLKRLEELQLELKEVEND